MWLLLEHPLLGTWPATQACAPTGNRTNWESNQRPFGSQASAQSTEPHQLGNIFLFLKQITCGKIGFKKQHAVKFTYSRN